MSQKLYMIRKSSGKIIGPLHAEDIKNFFENHSMSNCEISAHQQPWEFLEHATLKETYPEIKKIIKKDQHLQWEEIDYSNEATRIHKPKSKINPLKISFFIAFITISASGIWMVVHPPKQRASSALLKKAAQVHRQERGFSLWFDDEISNILKESRTTSLQEQWLPYLRKYAYQNKGIIPGLDPDLLKGQTLAPAPKDCSKDEWLQRWQKASEWSKALKSQKKDEIPSWLNILYWDTHWIRTRHQQSWLQPQNYLAGCLVMAKKALDETLNDSNFSRTYLSESSSTREAMTWISARLRWQTHFLLNTQKPAHQPSVQTMRGLWCVESVQDQHFDHCQKILEKNPDHDKSFTLRMIGQTIRIAVARDDAKTSTDIQNLRTFTQNIKDPIDPITGFDYSPEFRIIQLYIKHAKQTAIIKQRFKSEHPDILIFQY